MRATVPGQFHKWAAKAAMVVATIDFIGRPNTVISPVYNCLMAATA